jgi:hypothetical protein
MIMTMTMHMTMHMIILTTIKRIMPMSMLLEQITMNMMRMTKNVHDVVIATTAILDLVVKKVVLAVVYQKIFSYGSLVSQREVFYLSKTQEHHVPKCSFCTLCA